MHLLLLLQKVAIILDKKADLEKKLNNCQYQLADIADVYKSKEEAEITSG